MKLTNNFHESEIELKVGSNYISDRQIKRARKVLCGVSGCTCGGEMGERPRNIAYLDNHKFEYQLSRLIKGYRITFYPIE